MVLGKLMRLVIFAVGLTITFAFDLGT
jgi:hypothetical protein